jgi:thiamine pyrophosphate-dependent acetolactate synthase large subunit-like protein
MNRADAIAQIVERHPDAAIVFSNGLTSREAAHVADRPGNLYLLHGMGQTLSVGVGLRLARQDVEVVVVEGDGNALMGLSAWSFLPLEGLTYYMLENGTYETTGSQVVPRIAVDAEGVNRIQIENGAIGAPLPPAPEGVADRFEAWLGAPPEEV